MMLRHVLSFSQLNDISSEYEEEFDEESEEEAEEDIILTTSKISSSHEVNNYISFGLKNKNNITFYTYIARISNLIDDIISSVPSQPAFTCSKLTIETLEQGVKYVQS